MFKRFAHGRVSEVRRRLLVAGVAAVVLAGTTACGGGDEKASDSSTLRVVAVADRTGALSTSLGSSYLGAQAYVDKINDAGGVDGRKVDFEVLDSASTPDTAQLQFRAALEESPSAILHFGTSGGLTASARLLEGSPAPVGSVGAPDELVLGGPGVIYMNGPSAVQIISSALESIQARLGRSDLDGVKIAQLGLETPYTDNLFALAEPAAQKAGAEIVESIQFPFQVPSFTAQAAKVLAAKPDAVVLTGTGGEVPTVVGALRDAGFTGPVVAPSPGGQDDPAVIQKLGAENYSAARFFALPSDTDELASIAGSDNAGNAYFTNGWVSMKLVLDSVERCGCADAEGINKELQSGKEFTFGDLTYGPISFKAESRAGLSAVQFFGLDKSSAVAPVGPAVDLSGAEGS